MNSKAKSTLKVVCLLKCECHFIESKLQVSIQPEEPCSRIRLLRNVTFVPQNWASPPKCRPQSWLSDLGFIGCLMGLYSSISLSDTGPQTIQASTPLPFLFLYLFAFSIFPFVKLAFCALLIRSISVPFELCFLLAFLFIYIFFYFPFFFWPCSGKRANVQENIRKQSLWESHLLILSTVMQIVLCFPCFCFQCVWVCLSPFLSSAAPTDFRADHESHHFRKQVFALSKFPECISKNQLI